MSQQFRNLYYRFLKNKMRIYYKQNEITAKLLLCDGNIYYRNLERDFGDMENKELIAQYVVDKR